MTPEQRPVGVAAGQLTLRRHAAVLERDGRVGELEGAEQEGERQRQRAGRRGPGSRHGRAELALGDAVVAVGVDRVVVPAAEVGAAVELVDAAVAVAQRVVAGAAVDVVGAAAAGEAVVSSAAVDGVVAGAAVERVVAVAAGQ